jgi:hypothetical protein
VKLTKLIKVVVVVIVSLVPSPGVSRNIHDGCESSEYANYKAGDFQAAHGVLGSRVRSVGGLAGIGSQEGAG